MDAAERTNSWRRAQRQEGNVPITVWAPVETKAHLEVLARRRGQSLGQAFIDAVHALAEKRGTGKTFVMTEQQREQLKADVLAALSSSPALSPAPTPAPALAPAELPAGMKRCRKGHTYASAKGRECPECRVARQRRHRAKAR